jgi:glucosyl-dolichyl phosphate glucuronosyltransferase
VEISVVICTRDRAQQLTELLESMCALTPPGVAWELIIVDNGSTDNTPQVVESFEDKLPIRRVYQAIPGLSNARNAGVDAAQGAYIVWTDDDVHVRPEWLLSYAQAFKRWPDAAIFGGKITPVLLPPTPSWFERGAKYLGSALCLRDLGDRPVPVSTTGHCIPWGANYALRALEQKQYNYDPELGVAPGRRTGGEEVDVIERILASGKGGWWLPQVEVEHIVPPSRQTIPYVASYYQAYGDLDAYKAIRAGKRRLGAPLRLFITMPASYVRYRVARALGLSRWVLFLTIYGHKRGMFKRWFMEPLGDQT